MLGGGRNKQRFTIVVLVNAAGVPIVTWNSEKPI